MCGIIGIVAQSAVNQSLYDGLTVLQHRGQDAAGIATFEGGRFHLHKGQGLVRDAFQIPHMLCLKGNMGIGHVRYPTAGCGTVENAQPFYVNSPYGIALAHNGNLTNARQLREEIYRSDLRHVNTDSDSEILLNVLAHELNACGKFVLSAEDVFEAVGRVHRRLRGGYAVVAVIAEVGILGFRDPHAIRPVVFGSRETPAGPEHIIASESVAIDALGFGLSRDLGPGEAVLLGVDGTLQTQICSEEVAYTPCIFEHVYFARPDSIIDGISVHKARMRMGEALARKIQREWPGHDIDVVIPIPETSRSCAMELAHALRLTYREGFIKNRYIPRTFIMPGQAMRKRSVKQKLNAMALEFDGKNVLLVDDSIVRGNTSSQIIQMAREAGARKVYFASAAPPVCYPNVYGIDMPTQAELVAHGRTVAEVCADLGADRLIYQDLADLVEAARRGNPEIVAFDVSCFTGEYVTGDVDTEYLREIGAARSDEAKRQHEVPLGLGSGVLDLGPTTLAL
jgi:amidophosphoribosyltransferase